MYLNIEELTKQVLKAPIAEGRKSMLNELAQIIYSQLSQSNHANLNFICTHNSRRSHLCQIWAQVASYYYNLNGVICYSGGTAVTAMYSTIKNTLERQGFHFTSLTQENNAIHAIRFSDDTHPIIAFSKTYNDEFNPQKDYIAIMTCTQADQDCPIVVGATKRFALPFLDPKAYDHTPSEEKKYEEKSIEIASEMFFLFNEIVKLS